MTTRTENAELSRSLKEYLNRDIDYDKMCLLCGLEISTPIELNCCKKQFDYDCLVKYLQHEANYPNTTCPYCRQPFKSLPLAQHDKPLKYVHDEFYIKIKKDSSNINKCLGKKKNGSNCSFNALKNTNYCKKHQPTQNVKEHVKENLKCSGVYLSGKSKGQPCQHSVSYNSKFCKYHN
jgi:hypothetical protein